MPEPVDVPEPVDAQEAPERPPWRRRAAVAVAGLLAATVAVSAWLSVGAFEERPAQPQTDPALLSLARTAALAGGSDALTPIADPVAVAAPASAPGADQVEVCGLGWLDGQGDGSPAPDALAASAALTAARSALVESLRRAQDEFARAVGEWIAPSPSAAATAAAPASSASRDRRAWLARSTADPRVYALAFRDCQAPTAGGECSQLSAAQWARLDDGNALPWTFQLAEAAARRDDAGRDEALFRIARADRFRGAAAAALAEIASHAGGRDIEVLAAHLLAADALRLAASQPLPVQSVGEACGGPALADANKRQVCDGAARVLASRSDSPQAGRVAEDLGRRLGWPATQPDGSAAVGEGGLPPTATATAGPAVDLGDCAGLRRTLADWRREAEGGATPTSPSRYSAALPPAR